MEGVQELPRWGFHFQRDQSTQRRLAHESMILRQLKSSGVELVVLSGYMRILTPSFVSIWKGRLLNIHPSLLPDFPGAHAHRDALAAGVQPQGVPYTWLMRALIQAPFSLKERCPFSLTTMRSHSRIESRRSSIVYIPRLSIFSALGGFTRGPRVSSRSVGFQALQSVSNA